MKYLLALVAVLAIALGVAVIVYGGADDSPGAQLIGVALIIGVIGYGVRAAVRGRSRSSRWTRR